MKNEKPTSKKIAITGSYYGPDLSENWFVPEVRDNSVSSEFLSSSTEPLGHVIKHIQQRKPSSNIKYQP